MTEATSKDLDGLFERLARSTFRSRFKLGPVEREYLADKGMETILRHVREFVDRRLGPATPPNDGMQTPMRGHPAFVAQHATATCCRSCLAKWHGIAADGELEESERRYVVAVIERWLLATGVASSGPSEARVPDRRQAGGLIQPDLFDDRVDPNGLSG